MTAKKIVKKCVKRKPSSKTDERVWLFCEEYLVNLNASEAYAKAYPATKSPGAAGVGGLVYENWTDKEPFDIDAVKKIPGAKSAFGLDFGYTNDPSALFCGIIDVQGKRIFVFDEMYGRGMSNEDIAERVKGMGYGKERITADAEPKSIARITASSITSTPKW